MLAASLAGFAQIAEHARRPVYATAEHVRVANQGEQSSVFDGAIR